MEQMPDTWSQMLENHEYDIIDLIRADERNKCALMYLQCEKYPKMEVIVSLLMGEKYVKEEEKHDAV